MLVPRVFVPSVLSSGVRVVVGGSVRQHLIQVLRLTVGSQLRVFNSLVLGEFSAQIAKVGRTNLEIMLQDFIKDERESPLKVILWQGISRGDKMDFTIQKAVELGVSEIVPIFSEYCGVRLTADRLIKRQEHWYKIAISAAEQSGRCLVPTIHTAKSLKEQLASNCSDHGDSAGAVRFVLHPTATQSLKQLKIIAKNSVVIAIGPEGGFSDEELNLFQADGFQAIALGRRILRTETAALAVISALQVLWGDF